MTQKKGNYIFSCISLTYDVFYQLCAISQPAGKPILKLGEAPTYRDSISVLEGSRNLTSPL